MGNEKQSLTGLFQDIADTIREKHGDLTQNDYPIKPVDFADEIKELDKAAKSSSSDLPYLTEIIDRSISSITNDATCIHSYAFIGCSQLQAVVFPLCSRINERAFSGCMSLTFASFPNCSAIGSCTFMDCTRLSTIFLPNCISLGSSAFRNCYKLTDVFISSECSRIPAGAFQYCSALKKIPNINNIQQIGSSAFVSTGLSGLLSFPVATYIERSAFRNCSQITKLLIDHSVQLGSYAFFGLTQLSVAYFSSCSYISSTTISGWSNIKSIYIGDSLLLNQRSLFYNTRLINNSGKIYVPEDLLESYLASSYWSSYSNCLIGLSSQGFEEALANILEE